MLQWPAFEPPLSEDFIAENPMRFSQHETSMRARITPARRGNVSNDFLRIPRALLPASLAIELGLCGLEPVDDDAVDQVLQSVSARIGEALNPL